MKYAIFIVMFLLLAAFAPMPGVAADAPSQATESSKLSPLKLLGDIKGLFSQTEQLTSESAEAIQQENETSGWKETLGKIWQGVKDFFSDKTARDLLIETLKIFLQLVVNIFTIIANLLSKILGALSG